MFLGKGRNEKKQEYGETYFIVPTQLNMHEAFKNNYWSTGRNNIVFNRCLSPGAHSKDDVRHLLSGF